MMMIGDTSWVSPAEVPPPPKKKKQFANFSTRWRQRHSPPPPPPPPPPHTPPHPQRRHPTHPPPPPPPSPLDGDRDSRQHVFVWLLPGTSHSTCKAVIQISFSFALMYLLFSVASENLSSKSPFLFSCLLVAPNLCESICAIQSSTRRIDLLIPRA